MSDYVNFMMLLRLKLVQNWDIGPCKMVLIRHERYTYIRIINCFYCINLVFSAKLYHPIVYWIYSPILEIVLHHWSRKRKWFLCQFKIHWVIKRPESHRNGNSLDALVHCWQRADVEIITRFYEVMTLGDGWGYTRTTSEEKRPRQ